MLTWESCSWSRCGLSLGMVMSLLAFQTTNTHTLIIVKKTFYFLSHINSTEQLSQCECDLMYHKYSQRPPVRTLRVPSPVDHLRGHILHCTTEGISLLISIYWLFTQAKVCMTEMQSKMVKFTADWAVTSRNYIMRNFCSWSCSCKRDTKVTAEKRQPKDK